jgi:hypothetical protein
MGRWFVGGTTAVVAVLCLVLGGCSSRPVSNQAPRPVISQSAFDARTGQLTATWDRHNICCALTATMFPKVLWVSPTDRVFVATGYAEANQGTDLYVQNRNGLHQLRWPGLLRYLGLGNIVEPAVAW